ncbi:MAG: hypothetical protein KatS3mg111_1945 [Pirellulaceae bacterium]|nr:MAG: hypothetical protein KatS3mg111_1945 [Pirellulaceae bacterium]
MTLPLLLLFLLGALEISRMNMILETANNAAYEAARACIVPGATSEDGITAASATLNAIGVTGVEVVIEPSNITNATPSVTATVSIPYSDNLWLPASYATGSANVSCTLTRDWFIATQGVP